MVKSKVAAARLGMLLLLALVAGCAPQSRMLPIDQQLSIDRSQVTVAPPGFAVQPFIRNLSAPTAIAWDEDGSLLIAQGGNYNDEPTIIGFKKDGSLFQVYPVGRHLFVDIGKPHFVMYGPIGGMVVYKGHIYVSHRDEKGYGVITALDHNGGHATIQSHLPAQGDFSVTDLAIARSPIDPPKNDRLYFGVGAVTNSGVVGIDNWEWVQDNQEVHDIPWVRTHLKGFRFDSPNPFAGLFGPADIAVTAPFQPFNVSNRTEVNGSEMPSSAIYSCSPNGGDLRVEGHGIRCPRGLGFIGPNCYFTNNGMELRGTRPVKNDPDAILSLTPGGIWYGWPDFTTDLHSVDGDKYQPPAELIAKTGYFRVTPVIDLGERRRELFDPSQDYRSLWAGSFAPLSGAAKFDFFPSGGPFARRTGGRYAIVALSGDRAPFATSGYPITGPIGYKVVVVDLDSEKHPVTDFLFNTARGPGSLIDRKNPNLIERPVDVKFGPDGTLYILDGGRMEMHNGRPQWEAGTGKIFRVVPQPTPTMYRDPTAR
jgi:glucose/arabinose dehydrogenase